MKKLRLIAGVIALGLAANACGGAKVEDDSNAAPSASAAGSAAASAAGTVKIAINPWVGYEADAAVLAYLMEHELGYKVEKVTLAEEPSWQGMESGDVDVVIENWGHEDLKKKYIEEKKVAVEAGSTGNKGVIGWYVPEWMAQKYPDITDYKNLNKYADLFKTSESGGKGQLLDGDPSYVTNDEALVKNLKLDYKVVYAGSEAALIKAAKQATDQKKPLLMYFYEPQWLFNQVKLVKINLPVWEEGCDSDPKKVACDYPPYDLDKIVSKKFADTGGKAFDLVKNFQWTNDDQNSVADDMTNNGMSAEDAAKKWVEANAAKWQAWMPK
ncbi:ABC transporter substrate-binding protein [Microbispora amethystogenes]|uniref:Glycine/betaine-binding protein n=1 Tax=Microbispora amethystogenes TaxID=1427754 RepID=A0ABQ4FLB9_9ACTN|nr:ABC transporter substrate-binding protein [Microbispora amethystogenes]GIH35553.1 glycine/betaine-binding protein [Microbispora amethystogenes]